ncbi:MAG TPA: hypothetical protein VGX48_17300 [Pyrinomonadaceae bacterium]|jgi:hypothetical protein|nr:hypothetical protein [Pyrinomonadaceae bacterium]
MNGWRPILVLAAALLVLSAGAAASAVKETGTTTLVSPPVPAPTSPRKIDEYGRIRWSDERARLDNAAIEIQSDPTLQCYFVCYDGRVARAGEARRRCQRAANYIVRRHGIARERVLTMEGGFREQLTVEIWPVPAGAAPPSASQTVDPTEVRFIKMRPRRNQGRRRG